MKTKITSIDLGSYLETRQKMRLLPNLLDFTMAYSIFRPLLRFDAYLRPILFKAGILSGDYSSSLEPFLLDLMEKNLPLFLVSITGYLIFAIFYGLFGLIFVGWIKSLVLSDNKTTLWIILIINSITSFFIFSLFSFQFGSVFGALIASFIPFLYTIGAYTYLNKIKSLQQTIDFRPLVGIRKSLFPHIKSRYKITSLSSLKTYFQILTTFKRAIFYYVILGLLMLILRLFFLTELSNPLKNWISRFSNTYEIVFYIIVFISLSQVIAYTRRFIATEATKIWNEIRLRIARSVSEISQRDERPPILFLRSFQDDIISLEYNRPLGIRFLGIKNKYVRLEEVIADTLYPYGPIIALSNPKDQLPTLGAAKENVSNDSWKDLVKVYMDKAAKIVLIVGNTPSFKWEIKEIIQKGHLKKSIFILPPRSEESEPLDSLPFDHIPELKKSLALDTEDFDSSILSRTRVVSKNKDGQLYLILTKNKIKADAYSEALRWLFEKDKFKS